VHTQALALRGELDQVVSEYRRANQLLRPNAASAHVWLTLHQEVEKVRHT
jgi:hypothetical protein